MWLVSEIRVIVDEVGIGMFFSYMSLEKIGKVNAQQRIRSTFCLFVFEVGWFLAVGWFVFGLFPP